MEHHAAYIKLTLLNCKRSFVCGVIVKELLFSTEHIHQNSQTIVNKRPFIEYKHRYFGKKLLQRCTLSLCVFFTSTNRGLSTLTSPVVFELYLNESLSVPP